MSLAFDHPAGDLVAERPFEEPTDTAPVKLKGRPLLGVLPELRADPLRFFTRVARDHGDAVELRVGPDRVLMLNSPAMIRHVLQDNRLNYEKSKFYDVLRAILGDGIFLAEGEEWLSQRKTAGRSFQGCQLRRMTEDMQQAVADLERRWSVLAARQAVVDVIPEMMRLTLDILMRTLFSLRLEDQHEDIFRALTVILRDAEKRIWSPLGPVSPAGFRVFSGRFLGAAAWDRSILAHLSRRETVRLNTSDPPASLSTQKYPNRSNWNRLPGVAAARLGSTLHPFTTWRESGLR